MDSPHNNFTVPRTDDRKIRYTRTEKVVDQVPPQTPFLSITSGGVSPSLGIFIGVEVGWHLIAS